MSVWWTLIACALDLLEEFSGGSGAAPDGIGSLSAAAPVGSSAVFAEHIRRLTVMAEAVTYLFGDRLWLSGQHTDGPAFGEFVTAFSAALAEGSDQGVRISSVERTMLGSKPRPAQISLADLDAMLDRWNRTMDYWDAGVLQLAQVPPGGNTNFIAADVLAAKFAEANLALGQNVADGFEGLTDGLLFAWTELVAGRRTDSSGLCAQVRLRLDHEAVITRDAFTARLDLINSSGGLLENIRVDITIRDRNGLPATGLFGIGAPVLSGIGSIDGAGIVPPGTTGRATWLIIPTSEAAPDEPTEYFVGGMLSYRENGAQVNIRLAPAPITVLPNALLQVDYFHQRDVFSDDPFTEVIEPAEPFSLGVLVRNVGHGTARNVRITSAQPEIVDNERGLLIDFNIIGTQVGAQPLQPSLGVNLGDIASGGLALGRWLLTSTLQGLFIDYSATFEHIDAIGDPRLSLIERVNIHEMNRLVRAAGAFEDGLPDFLVNDAPDASDLPDTLYLSDGRVSPVGVVRQAVLSTTASGTGLVAQLSATLPEGWFYLRVPDPGNGRFRLVNVTRADGVVLSPENFWLTDRTFIGGGQPPIRENVLHLFDFAGTNAYTLYYISTNDVTPPASRVAALPAESYATIPLSWSGEDNSNGTGIAFFDVFVSVNGGPFTLWLQQTRQNGAIFDGGLGTNYAFYSVATDYAGNREPAPGTPDAQTRVTLTNRPPVIAPMPPIVGCATNEGAVFIKRIEASDPDGPILTFRLRTGPAGATIDETTGIIRWATGEAHGYSENLFVVEVCDNGRPALCTSTSFMVLICDVNLPPEFVPLPPIAINVGATLLLTNRAFDLDIPAQGLTFVLDTNSSPAGVRLTNSAPGEYVLRWTPSQDYASTTTNARVIVWDNGSPRLSATQDVVLIVNDFLAVGLGETVTRTEQSTHVPLTVFSSAGVVSLCFTLEVPAGRLTGISLSGSSPRICAITMTEQSPTRLRFCLETCPGEELLGTEEIARLNFTTASNRSAFVPLVLTDIQAVRADRQSIPSVAGRNGRVVVVGNEPLLEMTRAANHTVLLTVYGKPGAAYQLLWATNLPNWHPMTRIVLQGLFEQFQLEDATQPAFFVSAYEIQNTAVLELRRSGPGTVELLLIGIPGATYTLETTTDVAGSGGWTEMTTVTLVNSSAVLGGIVTSDGARFFRATRR